MKTLQFLHDYLKDEARITIEQNGEIQYEGDVISLPREIVKGTKIVNICGIGSEHDIIITVE